MARQQAPDLTYLTHDNGARVSVLTEDVGRYLSTGVFAPEGGDKDRPPVAVGDGGAGDLYDLEGLEFEQMSDPQMRAYAKREGIDLGPAQGDRTQMLKILNTGGASADPDEPDFDDEDLDLNELTVKQLNAYAVHHEVDLGGAKRKDDIIAVLTAE